MAVVDKINAILRRIPPYSLYVLGPVPGVLLFYRALSGGLGPDPLKPLEHGVGLYALQFLLAALLVTPLLRLARLNLMRFRRALGLLAFFYAFAHLVIWLLLDIQLRWPEIIKDLTSRPYLIVGMLAFLMLAPLAWTSGDAVIRRLGLINWRRLHLLAYPAAVLSALHFTMVQKTWQAEPLLYLLMASLLVFLKLWRSLPVRSAT